MIIDAVSGVDHSDPANDALSQDLSFEFRGSGPLAQLRVVSVRMSSPTLAGTMPWLSRVVYTGSKARM